MNLARFSIEKPLYGWMLILACLFGGFYGIDTVGRLEDPQFPIKTAYVITTYSGASAEEVELEVTDRIEAALQELPYVDEMKSKSLPGRSEIQVDLLEEFDSQETPQIFDELRRRVSEAAGRLPPGAGVPHVEDDFGDVYGILYAISAQDYSDAEIHDMATHISTQLKLVKNVAKIEVRGTAFEAIYVELDQQRLARLGLPLNALFQRIALENQVNAAGSIMYQGRRLRIALPQTYDSVEAVENMIIGKPGSTEILRLGDVATVSRGDFEAPLEIIRHNGERVFTVGVSITENQNVVDVGRAVDRKMAELQAGLPIGVEVHGVYAQHDSVSDAIDNFIRNLMMSVATVVLALFVFMGWRAGTVVGATLFLTVLGTIGIMSWMGIELQRISLGALMIAMGMLVDNGIVIAEGMVVGVRKGQTPAEAAARSVSRTQFALLGATVIGIMAFAPISLSDDNTGHFLVSLFQVIAISLFLSWILAITIVPMLGNYLLRPGQAVSESVLYGTPFYQGYVKLLGGSIRKAWLSTLIIVGITFSCIYSLQFVKQGFFPTTNTPLYYVDFRLPEGSDIQTTASMMETIESTVSDYEGVTAVSAFIGRGSPRFSAIIRPEQPNAAYGQLVVRVADILQMDTLMQQTDVALKAMFPDAEIMVTRAQFTPSGSSKIVTRFLGSDPAVLRDLADQALQVYLKHNLVDRKTDWRPQSLQLIPKINEENARQAGVSRSDIAAALSYSTYGLNIGLFRDGNNLIPIVARAPVNERGDLTGLLDKQVWSQEQSSYVPLSQIVNDLELSAANTTIYRKNRIRTIEAQANPPLGQNPTRVFNEVRADLEAIPLPPGYQLEWGGEYEASGEARTSLGSKIPLAFGLMFIITILMFGQLRQPIVIWLTVPMLICGVVIGLLATDLSLTFPSFLGVLSLSGMLIKNSIVLLDEIDSRLDEGEVSTLTLIQASVSRLRPVLLAAGTTIAGMSPLLADAFFREMAVCIMSGLAFATLLTLIAVPLFYHIALGRRLAAAKA